MSKCENDALRNSAEPKLISSSLLSSNKKSKMQRHYHKWQQKQQILTFKSWDQHMFEMITWLSE